ncbi:HK97 gp10 family phage protein [Salipaludibacillus agaradhaerens]|uniref:HK97 gp10 family phage protein n=1 Tax=Salipaludibacillus agaradhaerens TaxID=76935 RepID=A0A9Q4FXQ9_SALAG|nr:HK97-gp10 family putative phage morphogenesis protein [Salipaludibacillus agaradhaerens]MCR6096855.1 HK97 gp10 family phage protein [Salipaludibacillus agaradhaerens]MCR6116699.1 HK97 gp10 family phage protein [Salipaludibacillus agaradhaerens]
MSFKYESNRKDVEKMLTQNELKALESIGVFVKGEGVNRAPYDTDNLRSSINYRVNNSDKTVTIGTPVEYAPYVEKGTSRQQAQPYLTPAVEDNKSAIQKIVESVMRF